MIQNLLPSQSSIFYIQNKFVDAIFFVKNLFSYLQEIDESIIIHKKILKIGHKQIS